MKSLLQFVVATGLGAFSLALAGCKGSTTTANVYNDDLSLPLDDFALTERSGKTVKKSDLQGKVWIASFIFTRCPGPCPQVASTVARLQADLANEPDVRLVTFTVDPARDDPNELKKFAEIRGAHPERWLFLTGQEDVVRKLLIESFKVPASRNEKATSPADEFDHSSRLVVVDKQGNIRGYFQGMPDPNAEKEVFDAELQRLKSKVKTLLGE